MTGSEVAIQTPATFVLRNSRSLNRTRTKLVAKDTPNMELQYMYVTACES